MDIQAFIYSGNLELYVMGIAEAHVVNKVDALRLTYPEINQELREIELAIEQLAQSQAIAPQNQLKSRIMAALNFDNDTVDIHNLPITGKYSNYESWLKAVEHLIPADPFEDFFAYVLQHNENIKQTMVVTKLNVPEEVHEEVSESFFILKGTCTCTVGKDTITLNAGDYLDIPLFTTHDIRIDSPSVVAILQHQFL